MLQYRKGHSYLSTARIQKHTAHIGERSFNGTSKTTQEQLALFDALNLKKPA